MSESPLITRGVRSRVNETVRSWIPPRQKRQLMFLRNHGRWGNFKNPRTFSEKVNWRILNDRRAELAWTGDKLEMKERAAAVGVRSPETYWQGERVSTLAGVALPDHWVLKPNHRSSLIHFGEGDPDIEQLDRLTIGWTDETQSKVLGEWAILTGPSTAAGGGAARTGRYAARLQGLCHGWKGRDNPGRCGSVR